MLGTKKSLEKPVASKAADAPAIPTLVDVSPRYAAIVAKCGTKLACLEPYAPNKTVVRGGTYYAFQPDNGDTVHEYAAELAVRYFNEQREILTTTKLKRAAFKCGTPENARAWKALVDEFFGGRDLVPVCASAR